MDNILHQVAETTAVIGPTALVQSGELRRPVDVVRSPAMSADDKRAILAAWASDFYAVESNPALRKMPGTPEPVHIDDLRIALEELDRQYDC